MTVKQQRFVEEYLIDLNATQAAIRAGYSKNNADKIASELLGKTRVSEAVKKAMDARSKRTEITADRVLQEYAKIGFSNITDYLKILTKERTVQIDGSAEGQMTIMSQGVDLFDTDDVGAEKMRAVAEIKQTRDGIALKLHDKKGALDSIARHLGMFNDKLNVDVTVTKKLEDYFA